VRIAAHQPAGEIEFGLHGEEQGGPPGFHHPQALAQGVEFIACQMSMDMMGIQHEELLDEVTIGGVATYMERADKANVNLFI
jgi:predicted peroxiredoxin